LNAAESLGCIHVTCVRSRLHSTDAGGWS
jgi:hypothetical protein